ncbi:MAG TPA: copper resistance protein NlpE N-terminal domain-containing protein [Gammaproteobacteria bacterium]
MRAGKASSADCAARALAVACLAAGSMLAGCGSSDAPGAEERHLPQGELAGVYAGRFPCSNCEAIEATLWLRADGAFFLRQRYVVQDGPQALPAYARGRWRWDERTGELVLRAPGPERRLRQLDADRLQLETASPIAHVVVRDPDAPPFRDRLRLEGETAVIDGGIAFRDCLTGLAYAATGGAGYGDLRRQHRRLNRANDPSLTELDGHVEVVASADGEREVLVVDRFITLKPRTRCPVRDEDRAPAQPAL